MSEAALLREEAARCRRLAAMVTTRDVVETLMRIAGEYDELAAALEQQEEGDEAG